MAVLHYSSSSALVPNFESLGRRNRLRPISAAASPDPLTAVAGLLWGKSLPPQTLVGAVRTAWSGAWHLMMRQLAPPDPLGSYSRPASAYPSVPQEYYGMLSADSLFLRLYVGLPCPWAHRTLVVRAIRSLEPLIPVSVASPGADGSWDLNSAGGRRTLRDVYKSQTGGYEGRSTVPMLWDTAKKTVVCNESYGIVEFLNLIPCGGPDLSPPELREKIEHWNRLIYPSVNNGVYRCGFAQSQEAYNSAAEKLFDTLDLVEAHLAASRYLCGDTLTLADVCLFTTLIRFDLVYNVLFRCTKRKLIEFPNLHAYTRDIYQIPRVAETCNFEAIMDGYYKILFPLNPSSIRPVIPAGCTHEALSRPHNRA